VGLNRISPQLRGLASPLAATARTAAHCYPMRIQILPLAILLTIALHAQDVHVRVSPDVKTGIEGITEFPTIQMALDHHSLARPRRSRLRRNRARHVP
jgi:hypothetical protein